MRAVVDLNVFVAALINPAGTPADVVRAAFTRRYELVTCPRLVDELDDVLHRQSLRRYFNDDEADEFIGAVAGVATEVADPDDVAPVSRDPDDDYLVALAVKNAADFLVTGDPDLLDVVGTQVAIVPPARFLRELESR